MKKVRVLGLVGLAPVAVGVALPGANASAAVTHSAKVGTKTVSLTHDERAESPLITCGYADVKDHTSTHGYLTGQISYSHRCIGGQTARLGKRQTGLTERIRFYSKNGTRLHSNWTQGTIHTSSTYFLSFPNIQAFQVCQALVANSNHNVVKYGPVCEDATS
jgi:hypothetical protein